MGDAVCCLAAVCAQALGERPQGDDRAGALKEPPCGRQRDCVVVYVGSWPRERECIAIYEGSRPRERERVAIYEGSWPRRRECVVIYTGSWPQPSSGESQEATSLALVLGFRVLISYYVGRARSGLAPTTP